MQRNQEKISVAGITVALLIVVSTVILERGFVSNPKWYLLLLVAIPALIKLIIIFRRGRNKSILH
jgi:hypothetical protein